MRQMIQVKLCTNKQNNEQKFEINFSDITHKKDDIKYHNFIELKEKNLIIIFVSTSDSQKIQDAGQGEGNTFKLESGLLDLQNVYNSSDTEKTDVFIYNDNKLFNKNLPEGILQPKQSINGGVLGITDC